MGGIQFIVSTQWINKSNMVKIPTNLALFLDLQILMPKLIKYLFK